MNREITSGKWVRAKRTHVNLTQAQLAEQTGLTLRDIQRIEANDLKMSYKKYLALAIYFDVSLDEMLYGEVEE